MNIRHFRGHAFQALHVISVDFVITRRKYAPAAAAKKATADIAGNCRYLPHFAGAGGLKPEVL